WVLGLEPAASDTVLGLQRNATQAEMEAAASLVLNVTPGRLHFHPGVAKARVTLNGTGTIAITEDYGVAFLTDNGTGDYTITYDTVFSSTGYSWASGANFAINGSNGTFIGETSKAVGSLRATLISAGSAADASRISFCFFGDFA